MKCDYSEMVKCMEGNYVNITWRNVSKLCLPIVDHQYPSSRVDVLSDNVQQTNGCDHVRSSLETRVDNSDFLKESLPVQTCTITSENVDRTESVPNADFESTVGSHNSASSDTRSSITNAASKGCLHLNKSLNQGSDLTHKTTDKAIRHTEMTQGNVEKDEQTQPDVTVNGPSEGSERSAVKYPATNPLCTWLNSSRLAGGAHQLSAVATGLSPGPIMLLTIHA